MTATRIILCAVAGLAAAPAPVASPDIRRAGAEELSAATIDAGGGRVATGGLVLSATIGQAEAGIVRLGTLELRAGFWTGDLGPIDARIFRNGFE